MSIKAFKSTFNSCASACFFDPVNSNVRYLLTWLHSFYPRVRNIKSQLSNVDGLLFIEFNGIRTLTGWESYEAMRAFRNNGQHLDAMKNVKHIGKSKSITWEAESKPNWIQVKEKLSEVQFNA